MYFVPAIVGLFVFVAIMSIVIIVIVLKKTTIKQQTNHPFFFFYSFNKIFKNNQHSQKGVVP